MNNSKKVWNVIAIIAIVIAVILGINLYNKNTSYANVVQNDNNKACKINYRLFKLLYYYKLSNY